MLAELLRLLLRLLTLFRETSLADMEHTVNRERSSMLTGLLRLLTGLLRLLTLLLRLLKLFRETSR